MAQPTRVAVFASGNGTNAERLFSYFQDHSSIKIELLLCNKPSALVINRAEKWSIQTVLFDRNELSNSGKVQEVLESNGIDWIVLAGFLWLMPSGIVQRYPNQIVNLHPSLLPKYGGKGMYGEFVHKAVLSANEKESGITIHLVNEEYDKGIVLFQTKCKVDDHETPDSLAAKIHELEYKYLPTTLEKVIFESLS